jgi:NAD(P)-dependent dehydrogenase (short-subunit alcohol dehydrogenase family)
VYSASKHALEGLTKARVNVIAPGPIETAILNRFAKTDERKANLVSNVPLERAGKPKEGAQAIVFVSSDKASFITGASNLVDGGKTAR